MYRVDGKLSRMSAIHRIDNFEVIDVLGHGASSTIYAVQDLSSGQVYAIKHVVRKAPEDQRFVDQALNEHEVCNQLDHPVLRKSHRLIRRRKVLRVSELLVLMELVDGVTVEAHRPQGLRRMLLTFLAVTDGLNAMHGIGYLHCDIKPNNILVANTGGVKIIDFGQSCPVNTIKQRIQGTPDYISPEQVLRHPLTPRTDVFNLGATMYWCLTDQYVPTLIPKDDRIVPKHQAQLRPVVELNPKVPPSLSALVMQCLEFEPAKRPASMKEMHERLEIALRQLDNGGTHDRANTG